MKTQKRNQTTVYYANFESAEDAFITDEWGNSLMTGEKEVSSTSPTGIKMVVSPSTGVVSEEFFGGFADYDKSLVVEGDCAINEHSLIWIGRSPSEPHNYIVKKVAKSLNFSAYAVSRVEVSDGDSD